MAPDAREAVVQLAVGLGCAALLVAVVLRARRPPRRATLVVIGALAALAIVAIGVVEARVIAAVLLGSGVGVLIGGTTRALSERAPEDRSRRVAAFVLLAALSALPLVLLPVPAPGESLLGLTRVVAETSGGSWGVAWLDSWRRVLGVAHPIARVAVVVPWMLLAIGLVVALLGGVARAIGRPVVERSEPPADGRRE